MSTENIHHDSLLSSISNISVKIDHTEIDDPAFFRYALHKSHDQSQINGEVPIDAIEDYSDLDQGSLLHKIYFKYKPHHNGHQQNQHGDTWVGAKSIHGQSEDEHESSLHQLPIQAKAIPCQAITEPLNINNQSSQQSRRKRFQLQKRLKNQTKNIPKNYGKAIITFIQKYEQKVRHILKKENVSYDEFITELKEKKKVINTIADLRSMWLDYKYAKCIRLLSNLFLRKYSLSYIFNSRICNYSSHIKYRHRLSEAIKSPYAFKHIKDY